MRLQTVNPRGLAPSVDPMVLAENMAQVAINGIVEPGRMRPLKLPVVQEQPSKTGTVRSIFKHGTKWLNWITPVSVVKSPVAKDQWGRLYFAGGEGFGLQFATAEMANSGSDWPGATWDGGTPPPEQPVHLAVAGEITDDDPTKVEKRWYVPTYVSAYGEEGANGPPAGPVNVAPGQHVVITQLPAVPAGGRYNITHMRVYRTASGSEDTDYQMVRPTSHPEGLFALTLNEIIDDCASGDLGSVIATAEYDMPPDDLHSMIVLPCGAALGLSGNTVCVSVPYQLHAWPVRYRVALEHRAIAAGAYGNYVLVVTEGPSYLLAIPSPESMSPPEKAEEGYACVSGRGMVDMGYSLIYPAVDGLRMAGMTEMKLLTKGIIDHETWQSMGANTIHAYQWDGKYVAFWDENYTGTKGFVFDPATGDMTYHQVEASAGWTDPATGDLYLVTPDGIVLWDAGENMEQQWKGKLFFLADRTGFVCARVVAESYPLEFRFWSNGVLKRTREILSANPFKLPGGFLSQTVEYQVAGDAAWSVIMLATSEKEIVRESEAS